MIKVWPKIEPNKTYPIITRGGIREMSGDQAEAYAKRMMSPDERIAELEERVAELEKTILLLAK